MNDSDRFWDAVDAAREREARYAREAYAFVVQALGVTVEALPAERRADPQHRHLSGQELTRGVVACARREFGALAGMVFREWGLTRDEDIGHIVFQLVAAGLLSARPEDTMDDFRDGLDLLAALAAPGTPAAPRGTEPSA
jgi:uncharacterized repeat protein (TIGR04138 family)